MSILEVVEKPSHEDFDNEECQNSGDVVLDGQDIGSVLEVEECPAGGAEGIDQSESAIEGEFGDLSGGELAVGVAELDDACVGLGCVAEGADTVVAGAQDGVVDGGWVAEVDGLGDDLAARGVAVVGEDELAFLGGVAEACVGGGDVTDVCALVRVSVCCWYFRGGYREQVSGIIDVRGKVKLTSYVSSPIDLPM